MKSSAFTLSYNHNLNQIEKIFPHSGFDLVSFPATFDSWLNFVYSDDRFVFSKLIQDLPGSVGRTIDLRLLNQSGNPEWFLLSVNANGNDNKIEFHFININDRKKQELIFQSLLNKEQEQRKLNEVLSETGLVLSSTLDFDTVLDLLLEEIEKVIPYDSANLMLVKDDHALVSRTKGYEKFPEHPLAQDTPLNFNISETANLKKLRDTQEPLVIPDTYADPDWVFVPGIEMVRSWAGARIVAQGKMIGIFSLDKAEKDAYQPIHAKHLMTFAGQASLAIQNAIRFQELSKSLDREKNWTN